MRVSFQNCLNSSQGFLLTVITELTENLGVDLVSDRADHEMFVVDFAAYRYEGGVDMPRHLQWRLHNLQVSSKGKVSDVEQ